MTTAATALPARVASRRRASACVARRQAHSALRNNGVPRRRPMTVDTAPAKPRPLRASSSNVTRRRCAEAIGSAFIPSNGVDSVSAESQRTWPRPLCRGFESESTLTETGRSTSPTLVVRRLCLGGKGASVDYRARERATVRAKGRVGAGEREAGSDRGRYSERLEGVGVTKSCGRDLRMKEGRLWWSIGRRAPQQ